MKKNFKGKENLNELIENYKPKPITIKTDLSFHPFY